MDRDRGHDGAVKAHFNIRFYILLRQVKRPGVGSPYEGFSATRTWSSVQEMRVYENARLFGAIRYSLHVRSHEHLGAVKGIGR